MARPMALLATLAITVLLTVPCLAGETVKVNADSVVDYVRSCEKPYGAFGPIDNDFADVTWTYFAVSALKLLGEPIPHPEKITARGGILDNSVNFRHTSIRFFHKAALAYMLDAPFPSNRDRGELAKLKPVENGGFAGHYRTNPQTKVHNTYYAIWILSHGGENLGDVNKLCPKTPAWLASRQNADGSWNNFPAPGEPYSITASDSRHSNWKGNPTTGHVHLTYCALAAYQLLGAAPPNREKTIAWLQSCQGASGGFRRAPDRGKEDVWETWAAVKALKLLSAEPKDKPACLKFLNSLQNADGGFGDRPGWRSRLGSTFYALDALAALAGDARKSIEAKDVHVPPPVKMPNPQGMKIYSVYLHHLLQPEPAYIDMDHKAGVDVVGVINIHRGQDEPSHALPLRKYVKEKGYRMTVLENDLYYYGGVFFEGVGLGSHLTSSVVWPEGDGVTMQYKNTFRHQLISYDEVIEKVKPLRKAKGFAYMHGVADHEAAERIVFDSTVEGKGGYEIMATISWTDTIREHPWREKYIGRIPFMMDGIAHFSEPVKPLAVLYFARTLFVAKSPKYEDFIDAVKANRVVTVFYPDRTLYYGAPEWVQYVKKQEEQWRPRWPTAPQNVKGSQGPPR